MKCLYCTSKLEPKWNFCPECGHTVDRHNTFVNLIHKHLEQIKKRFSAPTYDRDTKEPLGGITISITTGFGHPQVSVIPNRQTELSHYEARQKKTIERAKPKEIVEPETFMKRVGNNIFVNVNLPEVKVEDDVEVNTLLNSVELRAYAGDKGYFKILDIPNSFGLADKKLKDGKLRLLFSQ